MPSDFPFVAPFALIRRDGKTWEFETLRELREGCLVLGVRLYEARPCYRQDETQERARLGTRYLETRPSGEILGFDWIARDSEGRIIAPRQLRELEPRHDWCRRKRAAKLHAESLGLPIPGTGRRRWISRCRSGRHVGAWRGLEAFRTDLREDPDFTELPVRLAERLCRWDGMPPDPWDDVPRARQPYRSWKTHRRSRWR